MQLVFMKGDVTYIILIHKTEIKFSKKGTIPFILTSIPIAKSQVIDKLVYNISITKKHDYIVKYVARHRLTLKSPALTIHRKKKVKVPIKTLKKIKLVM